MGPLKDKALCRATLMEALRTLRAHLEAGFSAETARLGQEQRSSSAGQCAAVALIVHDLLEGKLVSAVVEGQSHWFNRLSSNEGDVDVDLTADQFAGNPPVRMSSAGELYPGTRIRSESEVAAETRHRSDLLRQRCDIAEQKRT